MIVLQPPKPLPSHPTRSGGNVKQISGRTFGEHREQNRKHSQPWQGSRAGLTTETKTTTTPLAISKVPREAVNVKRCICFKFQTSPLMLLAEASSIPAFVCTLVSLFFFLSLFPFGDGLRCPLHIIYYAVVVFLCFAMWHQQGAYCHVQVCWYLYLQHGMSVPEKKNIAIIYNMIKKFIFLKLDFCFWLFDSWFHCLMIKTRGVMRCWSLAD